MRISDWSSDVCSSDLLLQERLRHGRHPALAMCAANAVAVPDPAGNRKLDKSKATGRIDGMVALAMAAGVEAMTSKNKVSVDDWLARSEESRVGQEWVSMGRSGCVPEN